MFTSIKNISRLLVIAAIVMISSHTLGMLASYCGTGEACLGAVYFGLSNDAVPFSSPELNYSASTDETADFAGFSFAEMHVLIQVVGLYALLIGVIVLIFLELIESRNIKKLLLAHKRPRAHAK